MRDAVDGSDSSHPSDHDRVLAFLTFREDAESDDRSVPRSGDRVAGYTLGAEIGRGGVGVVFRARDEALGRDVALKLIPAALSDVGRQRAESEGRLLAAVRHDSIVPVYATGFVRGFYWVAMELVDGESLMRCLAGEPARGLRPGEPDWLGWLLPYLRQIAAALGSCHARGILHRDIKPSNVLIGSNGQAYLVDFGLARVLDVNATATVGFVGTPCYASPEQVRGEPLTAASDVFSFGAMMFEAITGVLAFSQHDRGALDDSIRFDDPVWPRRVRASAELRAIVERCLEKDPGDRYPSGSELAADLARFLHFEPVRAIKRGRLSRFWQRVRRRPGPFAVRAGGVLLGSAVVALWFHNATQASSLQRVGAEAQFARAVEAYEIGDLDAAGRMFANLAGSDYRAAEAIDYRGELALRRGELGEARRMYRASTVDDRQLTTRVGRLLSAVVPTDSALQGGATTPREHAMLGRYRFERRDFAAAKVHLDLALAKRNVWPWLVDRARCHLALYELRAGGRDALAACSLWPDSLRDATLLETLCFCLRNTGKAAEAVRVIREGRVRGIDSDVHRAHLALCLLAVDRRSVEAREEIAKACSASSLSECADLVAFAVAMCYGAEPGAPQLAFIDRVLAERPESPGAWAAKTLAASRRSDWSAAVDAAQKGLGHAMVGSWALSLRRHLAIAWFEQQRFAEAAVELEAIEELVPGDAAISSLLGRALLQLGRLEAAFAASERAMNADQTSYEALVLRGQLHAHRGEFESSIPYFMRACGVRPDRADAWYKLANAQVDLGQNGAAWLSAREATRLSPVWGWAWVTRALVESRLGKSSDSVDSYRRAVAIVKEPRVRLDLAEELRKLGRMTEALIEVENALRLAPESPYVLASLGELLSTADDSSGRDLERAERVLRHACRLADVEFRPTCERLLRAAITARR